MALWNDAQLEPPVNEIIAYHMTDRENIESMSRFVSILTTAANTVGADHPVWAEIQVFYSLKPRMSSSLPCDKFLQTFQRIGHCLQKIIVLQLSKLYLNLAERFLSGFKDSSPIAKLPSRQQLEFVLIRTQGSAKLIFEALSFTRESFCFLIQKLKIGHTLQNLLMACSVTARISVLLKSLLMQVCDIYQKCKPWCEHLQQGAWDWGRELELPDDLWQWLKPEENEFISKNVICESNVSLLSKLFKKGKNLKRLNDANGGIKVDDFVDNSSGLVGDKASVSQEDSDDNDCTVIEPDVEIVDLGEVIQRQEAEVNDAARTRDINEMLSTKIASAKNLASLWTIWENTCNSENEEYADLIQELGSEKIREINDFFSRLQNLIITINRLNVAKKKKQKKRNKAITKAKTKLMRFLKPSDSVVPKQEKDESDDIQVVSVKSDGVTMDLKPTSKLKVLKKMFSYVHATLQTVKQFKRAKGLTKRYVSAINDAKLLKQNSERQMAKTLLLRMSKAMIKMYKEVKC